MGQSIIIDPVTRIEGHSKVTIFLNDEGKVSDAKLHVNQFRGFEKLCEGRPYYEMPSLTERICGICPIIHSIASAKACESIMGVLIPSAAVKLRRLIYCGQIIQSHALSFYHLSLPDLLPELVDDVNNRNVFGLMQINPSMAKDGIRLRTIGQKIIEGLAGKRIHPAWVVPGGVNSCLSDEQRQVMISLASEALSIVQRTLDWFKGRLESYREEIRTFANFPGMFMALTNDERTLEYIEGKLRFIDYQGNNVGDLIEPDQYAQFIGETVRDWSYLKSPFYIPFGPEDGVYRVGPVARLNICRGCGTPLADQEWAEFRGLFTGPCLSSFYNHYARLIEILHAVETTMKLLDDQDIISEHIRAFAQPNYHEGIGVVEAPRGTLIHHYRVDDNGLMTWANLIVATGNNEAAMNRGILQAARNYLHGTQITDSLLNKIEAVVRAFDPCLSCSTHAVRYPNIALRLVGPEGNVLDEVK